jgi:mono/diheme cytochrome c family protein
MIVHRLRTECLFLVLGACVTTLFASAPAHAQQVDAIYSQSCAACHGDKGHGDGPAGKYLKPAPTDFATSLKGKSDDWITEAITQGGAAVGESPVMPGFKQLSADQVKSLVNYIKKFGS